MVPGNFNWFLHVMLFYHSKKVIQKQKIKAEKERIKQLKKQNQEQQQENEDDEVDEVDMGI